MHNISLKNVLEHGESKKKSFTHGQVEVKKKKLNKGKKKNAVQGQHAIR